MRPNRHDRARELRRALDALDEGSRTRLDYPAHARCYDAAIGYACRGWPTLPAMPREKAPHGALVPRGVHNATCVPGRIDGWYRAAPDANVGIALGPRSGLAVIDLDGADAVARWAELAEENAHARTLTSRTAKGFHAFYRWPDEAIRNVPGMSERGLAIFGVRAIELLGDGRYVLAPPSVHPTGHVYAWARGRGPGDVEPAALPAWLLVKLRASAPVPATEPWTPRTGPESDAAARWALRALQREARELAAMPRGGRNDRLWRAAAALGGLAALGVLLVGEIERALAWACAQWPPGERDARKDLETLRRGLDWGRAHPRTLPTLGGAR